tara:strand:- start:1038 stop:2678 length:1641 start_codon:yes stop_codon:yes gene_type:complete
MKNSAAGDAIAKLIISRYIRLPKRGKPQPGGSQWTILAGFVVEDPPRPLSVVALATGTKCVGGSSASSARDDAVVCDSHAEVLARRALVRWLLDQASLATCASESDDSVFIRPPSGSGRLQLRSTVKLHMYVSQAPCGDATITRAGGSTGAHPVEWERYGRHDGKTPSILRTKPGKGAVSHSLSCSDKIAIWNVVGVQGALLAHLIEPVFLASIAVGDDFCRDALQRALWQRARPLAAPLPVRFRRRGAGAAGEEDPAEPMIACLACRDASFAASRESLVTAAAAAAPAAAATPSQPQPCGHSVNWFRTATTTSTSSATASMLPQNCDLAHLAVYVEAEATLAKTGLRIGTTKRDAKLVPAPPLRVRSRLCRRNILVEFDAVYRRVRAWRAAAQTTTTTTTTTSLDTLLLELSALVAASQSKAKAVAHAAEEEQERWSRVHRALKGAATDYQNAKEALRAGCFAAWQRRRAAELVVECSPPLAAEKKTSAEKTASAASGSAAIIGTGDRDLALHAAADVDAGASAAVEPPQKKQRAASSPHSTTIG